MATTINKLHHQLREPAQSVEADYIAIYNKKEVNYYDAKTTQINVSNEAVLTGWRCSKTRLWRVPLVEHPTNVNPPNKVRKSKQPVQRTNNESNPGTCTPTAGTINRSTMPDGTHQQHL